MAKILERSMLAPKIVRLLVECPDIAKVRKPGQFLILRPNADSERIPLSIADTDAEKGTLELVVQEVGRTSAELLDKQVGDEIHDVVGPLGTPTHIEKFGTAICIGGGVGIAPLYPIAKALRDAGNIVVSILGARTKELIIFEERMREISDVLIVTTDDGSHGRKGLVTDALKELIHSREKIDYCITVGPPIMMHFVCETTRPYNIPTFASLNTMMVDGTGMCGGCRITVGGENKYVCVDGPEFDGHQVDFTEMMMRLKMYKDFEKKSYEEYSEKRAQDHQCKIGLNQ